MKIIRTDNFDRSGEAPGRDEVVIATVPDEYGGGYGAHIVDALNERFSGANAPHYFIIRPDDYEPRVFAP